jgi:hypothetical protein
MGGIIKAIISGIIGAIFDKIDRWWTQKQLEEAESKKSALEAYLKSKEDSENLTEEMEAASMAVEKEYHEAEEEVEDYKEKLAVLRKLKEKRELRKIKKDLPK